ncbi:MAG: hypothetical protein J6U49_05545 [Alistipes sp.]|nr:hypothetical protein [Alistipes sp.]
MNEEKTIREAKQELLAIQREMGEKLNALREKYGVELGGTAFIESHSTGVTVEIRAYL